MRLIVFFALSRGATTPLFTGSNYLSRKSVGELCITFPFTAAGTVLLGLQAAEFNTSGCSAAVVIRYDILSLRIFPLNQRDTDVQNRYREKLSRLSGDLAVGNIGMYCCGPLKIRLTEV